MDVGGPVGRELGGQWCSYLAAICCDCRESRVEQTEVRFKDYRRELKEHAQALAKVGQELQVERANKDRLKVELDQELRSREKARRDLKEEQNTTNLLREQVGPLVA